MTLTCANGTNLLVTLLLVWENPTCTLRGKYTLPGGEKTHHKTSWLPKGHSLDQKGLWAFKVAIHNHRLTKMQCQHELPAICLMCDIPLCWNFVLVVPSPAVLCCIWDRKDTRENERSASIPEWAQNAAQNPLPPWQTPISHALFWQQLAY